MLPVLAIVLAAAPLFTTPEQLRAAYKENPLAADKEFKNHSLDIFGRVTQVRSFAGNYAVMLGPLIGGTRCTLSENQLDEASTLKAGQLVGMRGRGAGEITASTWIADCAITWKGPLPGWKKGEQALLKIARYSDYCVTERVLPNMVEQANKNGMKIGPSITAEEFRLLLKQQSPDGGAWLKPAPAKKLDTVLDQMGKIRERAAQDLAKMGAKPVECTLPILVLAQGCETALTKPEVCAEPEVQEIIGKFLRLKDL